MRSNIFIIAILACLHAFSPLLRADEQETATKAEMAELRAQVQDLTKLVKDLQAQLAAKSEARPSRAEATPAAPEPAPASAAAEAPALPESAFTMPKQADLSRFNPEISAALDVIGSYDSASGNSNTILRDAEVMVQANVDQLAHAYVVFNAETELDPGSKADPFEEHSLGVEEAAIETTALPFGLGLKAGQFFADFTRLGKVHSHELPFTDRPAPLDEIIGGETKARGVEINWVPPASHYFRLTAGAVDNIGAENPVTAALGTLDGEEEDLFTFHRAENRSFDDIFYYGRMATMFELGDNTLLNVGADYGRGSDAGERELASADFKLTWTPDPSSYDQFTTGGEFLWGRSGGEFSEDATFADGPSSGRATAEGAYLYAQYRFGKTWEPGVRLDWFRPESWAQTDRNGDGLADGLESSRDTIFGCSAYLNYHINEFNCLRLGLGYHTSDEGAFGGSDDDWTAFLQWSIILGPHKHSFQP